jgi:excisionase family DNA binding protein
MDDKIEKMAFSVDETAMRTGLGRDRIYTAIRDGNLVARKFGRRTLITANALQQFLDTLPQLRLPSAAQHNGTGAARVGTSGGPIRS